MTSPSSRSRAATHPGILLIYEDNKSSDDMRAAEIVKARLDLIEMV